MDIQQIKNILWSKVDEWSGAQYKNNDDWSAYKKRADGWYSRHKFALFGDHFFNLLLRKALPELIGNIIQYDINNSLSVAAYHLIYTMVFYN